jgi:hypothetical protein
MNRGHVSECADDEEGKQRAAQLLDVSEYGSGDDVPLFSNNREALRPPTQAALCQ